MENENKNVIPFPRKQVEDIDGVSVDLAQLSLIELQVLETNCGHRFKQTYAELEIVRGAIKVFNGFQGGDAA